MFQPEVCAYLFKVKEGDPPEAINHRCSVVNALGVNTWNISRIALKLHCMPKFKPVAKSRSSGTLRLGKLGLFEIGSKDMIIRTIT